VILTWHSQRGTILEKNNIFSWDFLPLQLHLSATSRHTPTQVLLSLKQKVTYQTQTNSAMHEKGLFDEWVLHAVSVSSHRIIYPICTWAGSHYGQDWNNKMKIKIKSNWTGYLLLEVNVNWVQVPPHEHTTFNQSDRS